MTDRKKPAAGFWITVALAAVLVGYPLSFGPACWISSRVQPRGNFVSAAYRPLLRAWIEGPDWIGTVLGNYASIGPLASGFSVNGWEPPEIRFDNPDRSAPAPW